MEFSMEYYRNYYLLLFINIVFFVKHSHQGYHEERLIYDIFEVWNYSALARPVENELDALEVNFGITLQQIIDVNEKSEMLHTNMWLNYNWTDYKLKWNASEYGGIHSIRLPAKLIWTPDILLYNTADEDIDSKYPTNIVVYSTGEMNWVPMGLFITSCEIKIRWFPFDEQRCIMKFGSWSYDGSKINLTLKLNEIDMTQYQKSGEWDVIEYPAIQNIKYYSCCPEPFIDVTFTLRMKRRPLYYAFNLIIPCTMISAMTLLAFSLPPDSGEKIGLGVTILLSLSVFLLIVAQSVPATSIDLPLLGIYFLCIMVMCTLSVLMTVLVLNFHHRNPETYEMPQWVRSVVCEWMAWFLRVRRPGQPLAKSSHMRKTTETDWEMNHVAPVVNMIPSVRDQQTMKFHNSFSSIRIEDSRSSFPREELLLILKELRFITGNIKEQESTDEEIGDWKFAAMVIDRLCLWLFTAYTLFATMIIFFTAPVFN